MNLLFQGNFFSGKVGTLNPSEWIGQELHKNKGINVGFVSRKKNKVLRALDVFWNVSFSRFDLLHIDVFSGMAFYYVLLGSWIARTRKKRVILNIHGGRFNQFSKEKPGLTSFVLNRADLILSPSLFLKEKLEEMGYKINYLPNPILIQNFPYQWRYPSENRILWIRAFSKIYRPTLALKTLLEIRKELPNATLTMIGPDKGERQKVEKMVEDLGLWNAVKILGPVKNFELLEYYSTHSAFLNTTRYESFGMTTIESMAVGLPVVSGRVGELPYLYEKDLNIVFAKNDDEKSFSQGVLNLLLDQQFSENISRNARGKVENYSWDRIRPQWIDLIENKS